MTTVEIRLKGSGKRLIGAVDEAKTFQQPVSGWVTFYTKTKTGWVEHQLLVSEVAMYTETGTVDDKAVKGTE